MALHRDCTASKKMRGAGGGNFFHHFLSSARALIVPSCFARTTVLALFSAPMHDTNWLSFDSCLNFKV